MISIIIPVFNSAAYLDDCLNSIVSQSYTDFELIIINDGSTDGSGQICDDWGRKDSRVRVIHQVNQGVSAARNHGIKVAKGEFITFVDSDDWIDKDYLLKLVSVETADLVVSGMVRDFLHKGNTKYYVPLSTCKIELGPNSADFFVDLNVKFLLFGPVAKLYKRDIIVAHSILFPVDCSLGEDLEFNYQYLKYVCTISCLAESHYHYMMREIESLSSRLRIDQFDIDYRQWKIQKELYEEKNMWNLSAKQLLYRRLWEIVHDALFRGSKIRSAGWAYIKKILSIKEIDILKEYTCLYPCAKWIKISIFHRWIIPFYCYYFVCNVIGNTKNICK